MAKVKKIGNTWCVTHSTNGTVLKRKGKRACYEFKRQADADARNTRCRNLKVCPVGSSSRVGP